MRAIIIASGADTVQEHALPTSMPSCMLTLADRPFLQHVVEYLIGRGFTELDFVLSHAPQTMESWLGDGTRWGSRFRFHLARDAQHPYGLLPVITAAWADEPFMLVHADCLPRIVFDEAIGISPCLFYPQPDSPEDELEWTGWAWLTPREVAALPRELNLRQLELALLTQQRATCQVQKLERVFSVRKRADLLAAQAALLQNEFPELLLTGRVSAPHIHLSGNARVHPTAQLIAPVFIGKDTHIGAGCIIGPNAVIDRACFIERDCVIQQSTVLAHSYVGAGVTLEQALVSGNELDNLRMGTRFTITDDFALDRLAAPSWKQIGRRGIERVLAGGLLLLAAPLLLFCWLWRKGETQSQSVVALPAPAREEDWMTYELLSFADALPPRGSWRFWLHYVLPGLWNVLNGDLLLWGTRPRTYAEISRLPDECRIAYLQSTPGLLYADDASSASEPAGAWPKDVLNVLIHQHSARG
jgi:dTDP-glucose pyrophosphorylase